MTVTNTPTPVPAVPVEVIPASVLTSSEEMNTLHYAPLDQDCLRLAVALQALLERSA